MSLLKYEASGGHELRGRTDDDSPIAIIGSTGGTSELPCAAARAVDGAREPRPYTTTLARDD